MSRRHDEPNASYYSSRYAERKRAAERERDARGPRPSVKCSRPSCENLHAFDIYCADCREEFERLRDEGAYSAADAWVSS